MKKLIIALVVVGGIVVLAGLSLAGRGDDGTMVSTETVGRRDLVSVVTASGKIEPKRKVDISADISGRVIQVAVEEGQWVERGALLLRIDPSQYEAAVRRAEASVNQAQARAAQARAQLLKAQSDVKRNEFLAQGRELISAADLENSRTQAQVAQAELEAGRFAVAQAQASLAEARDALSKTTIRAPMAGRVTRLNIEEGETAVIGTMNNPGSLLLTVADLSVMEAKVKVDETDVPGITVGDSASVRIDAFPGKQFPGRVTRIANSAVQTAGAQAGADQQSVDFEVVITLDSPPAELRPDLSATAEVVTEQRRNALSIPIISLTVRDREGKKFAGAGEAAGGEGAPVARRKAEDEVQGVFVVKDGKAAWVPVETGITGSEYFEVTRGLQGGETVVSGTFQVIKELEAGDAVRVPAAAGEKGAKGGAEKGE